MAMLIRAFVFFWLGIFASCAMAQSYPSRALRLIVPFPPGGSTDIVARMVTNRLSAELGQPVVIENRGGSSGLLGAEAAAKAPPDGYTLFLAASSVMSINATIFSKLPYDPLRSFSPVSMLAVQPLVIVVHPGVAARTLAELVSLSKEKPGAVNFGSAATSVQLPLLYFNTLAGIRMQDIPYKGLGPATTALIAGEIDVLIGTLGTLYPHIRAGKMRALAATSRQRTALAPELPTVAEQGFPGFDTTVWNGLSVPAGTPRGVIEMLNREIVKSLKSQEVMAQFLKQGIEAAPSTPEEFGEHIRTEIARWQKVAREAGIKPE